MSPLILLAGFNAILFLVNTQCAIALRKQRHWYWVVSTACAIINFGIILIAAGIALSRA